MPNTNKHIVAALISVFLAATVAYAGDTPQEIKQRTGVGNPVAGKDKSALCQGCHGEDGNSAVPNFPKLAGQYAGYIARQINNFQTGTRKDPTMTDMAATVTNRQDLNDIAAYFASQNQMSGTPIKHEAGEKLFVAYGCLNCHGEIGKGRPANNSIFPVIGGQHKDYLVKQLNDFKTGARDTDMSGTMSELTVRMTDAEIEAVSEYLSGL
jgi:cytochrome c553